MSERTNERPNSPKRIPTPLKPPPPLRSRHPRRVLGNRDPVVLVRIDASSEQAVRSTVPVPVTARGIVGALLV